MWTSYSCIILLPSVSCCPIFDSFCCSRLEVWVLQLNCRNVGALRRGIFPQLWSASSDTFCAYILVNLNSCSLISFPNMSKMVSGDISLHPTAPLTRARASIILSPVQWWITSFSPSPMDTSRTSLVNPPDEYCLWWISLLKVKVLVVQSCLTLCNSMDYIPSQSCVHGILQARILEWVAIPFSRGPSQPRDWTHISCTAGRFCTNWATRETHLSS